MPHFLLICCLFIALLVPGYVEAKKKSTAEKLIYSVDEPLPKLSSSEGFLLLKLNVESEAASIHYAKMKVNRTGYLQPGDSSAYQREKKLSLSGLAAGYYLVPLKQGIYQITRIGAPFYQLPYYLSLDSIKAWRFSVEAEHLNYAGELVVEKERGLKHINVDLLNRFAADQAELNLLLAKLSTSYPLLLSPGYRDDFQQLLAEE